MSAIKPTRLPAQDTQPAVRDPRIDDVAKLYEKQFLREMVKAMRQTVSFAENTKPSMAENIYRDQLDNEYVESWGDMGGIGLSDMIYEQVMNKYFSAQGMDSKDWKGQKAVPLTERDQTSVQARKGPDSLQVKVQLPAGGPDTVLNPMDGKVFFTQSNAHKSILGLQHDFGLQSVLEVPGTLRSLSLGQDLKAGDRLAFLPPEAREFFWNFRHLNLSPNVK